MQYMLLIYWNESDAQRRTPEQNQAITREYVQFTKEIEASGHLRDKNRLESVANATSVRLREGKVLKTDGPFAETREQLGGYFLVEAKDLDEAVAVAARMPGARFGTIEVRPVMPVPAVT